MSQRYLLLADADKIQHFVLFRASTLREVVGASALLTRFCNETAKDVLGLVKDDIIVNDGGSFRLLFDSEEEAAEASEALADYYYMATGAQMSVAPPEPWDGTPKGFKVANRRAGRLLRSAKRHNSAVSVPHLPPVAFCTSAGVDLAARYGAPKPNESNETYLSRASLYKNRERDQVMSKRAQELLASSLKTGLTKEEKKELHFLGRFASQLEGFNEWGSMGEWPESAEEVGWGGGYDPRDYVAYLVADGNGMGKIFNGCATPKSLRDLSNKLTELVCQSLAAPTNKLMRVHTRAEKEHFIPVLPLILGGDDLFALLPAPWSISFAQQFCEEFEKRMNAHLETIPSLAGNQASMAAAVVICKSSYPFHLAHKRGEQLLKSAKQLGKYQAAQPRSTVTFEVITGNDSVDGSHDGERYFYPSLRPYWTSEAKQDKNSIALQKLLDARENLDSMPQKRRSQLRTLFMDVALQGTTDNLLDEWVRKFDRFFKRLSKLDEPAASSIDKIMGQFGHTRETRYWRPIQRGNKDLFGNGLLDLLDAWDFLYDLEKEPTRYEEWLS